MVLSFVLLSGLGFMHHSIIVIFGLFLFVGVGGLDCFSRCFPAPRFSYIRHSNIEEILECKEVMANGYIEACILTVESETNPTLNSLNNICSALANVRNHELFRKTLDEVIIADRLSKLVDRNLITENKSLDMVKAVQIWASVLAHNAPLMITSVQGIEERPLSVKEKEAIYKLTEIAELLKLQDSEHIDSDEESLKLTCLQSSIFSYTILVLGSVYFRSDNGGWLCCIGCTIWEV